MAFVDLDHPSFDGTAGMRAQTAASADRSALFAGKKRRRSSFAAFAMPSAKRAFDLAGGLAALPVLVAAAPFIWWTNRTHNPGPLLFRQKRMGRGCKPFTVIKFRTMLPGDVARGPDDPLEIERITPFGRMMRRTRLDELPQVLNVLRGEMSLIGPRPDAYEHATAYLATVPGYRARHTVRPGVSGLAQITLGYAEGTEATARKVQLDLAYIRNPDIRIEMRLVWRTIAVICSGFGAK